TADYTITAAAVTGTDAARFALSGADFPLTVAAGAFVDVRVAFDSNDSAEVAEAGLEFTGNDPYAQSLALIARGSPVSGGGFFNVRQVHSDGTQVTDLFVADDLLSGVLPASSEQEATAR